MFFNSMQESDSAEDQVMNNSSSRYDSFDVELDLSVMQLDQSLLGNSILDVEMADTDQANQPDNNVASIESQSIGAEDATAPSNQDGETAMAAHALPVRSTNEGK